MNLCQYIYYRIIFIALTWMHDRHEIDMIKSYFSHCALYDLTYTHAENQNSLLFFVYHCCCCCCCYQPYGNEIDLKIYNNKKKFYWRATKEAGQWSHRVSEWKKKKSLLQCAVPKKNIYLYEFWWWVIKYVYIQKCVPTGMDKFFFICAICVVNTMASNKLDTIVVSNKNGSCGRKRMKFEFLYEIVMSKKFACVW